MAKAMRSFKLNTGATILSVGLGTLHSEPGLVGHAVTTAVKDLKYIGCAARIPPAVNQVEIHPSWQQEKLRCFCKSNGIRLLGYSPLGSPGSWFVKGEVLASPILNEVADRLDKSPAQIALRWGLQNGNSVLPKSTDEIRIKENFDVFGWDIPEELFAKFSEIEQARLIRGDGTHETLGAYRTIEELWDGEL